MRGSPSALRISLARAVTSGVWASSSKPRRVDRDRERRGAHGPPVGQVDEVAVGLVPDPLADQAHEVRGAAGQLEPDQVGAEQPLEQLASPRQLLEQLGRRERDVQVEADPQVGPELRAASAAPAASGSRAPRPARPRWPARRPCRRTAGSPRRRSPTTRGGTPAWPRGRGRAATGCRWRSPRSGPRRPRRSSASGTSVEAVDLERLEVLLGAARPAQPDAVVGAHHRLDRASPGRPGTAATPTVPSGCSTRSTGSRFATITRSWPTAPP